jgi:hypothetical protein
MTITAHDIKRQVLETLDGWSDEHDVDGIVSECIDKFGRCDISDVPSDYWNVVYNHRLTSE